jgi:Carboxypeptidase regulatory-like domain
MNAWNRLLLGSAVAALVGGCVPEEEFSEPSQELSVVRAAMEEASIGGIVTTVDGGALANATVTLATGQRAVTREDGSFRVSGLKPNQRLPVTISAPGYASTVRIYSVEEGQNRSLRIPLQALEAPVTFLAENGTTLALPGESSLEILPGSLITRDTGRPASGPVRATRALWEATNPASLAAAPGDFTVLQPDGSSELLQSFGMFRVELTDSRGTPLTFRPDRPGRIRLPVTEQLRGLPLDQVALFAFEPRQGVWLQNQVLTLDATGTVLQGTLNTTLVDWNYDMVQDTTCIIVNVKRYSIPLPVTVQGATTTATGLNYNGSWQGFSDASGNVCLNVRKNSSVKIDAYWINGTSTWMLPSSLIINPTPNNQARCDINPSACTVISEPVILDLIVGGGR